MLITRETEGLLPWTEGCIEGKVVVVKPEYFKPEYRNAKWQLVVAYGGFGCYPEKMGKAVFVQECTKENPENYRSEKQNILGIASEELIAEWKKEYGEFNDEAVRYTTD